MIRAVDGVRRQFFFKKESQKTFILFEYVPLV